MTHLNISNAQISIGEERVVVTNPLPSPLPPVVAGSGREGWSYHLLLMEQRVITLEGHAALQGLRISDLELQVETLENRTFWSMLKDWIGLS